MAKYRAKYATAWRSGYAVRKAFALKMRKSPTVAEAALWMELRRHGTGRSRWRRQHVIGRFIVDFVHLRAQVVVEVDGPYHLEPEMIDADRDRDETLTLQGWLVLRFTNGQVLDDTTEVASEIMQQVRQRL